MISDAAAAFHYRRRLMLVFRYAAPCRLPPAPPLMPFHAAMADAAKIWRCQRERLFCQMATLALSAI